MSPIRPEKVSPIRPVAHRDKHRRLLSVIKVYIEEVSLKRPETAAPIQHRDRLVKIALLLASLAVSLGLAELVLRAINYAPAEYAYFRENPNGTASYRLRPNLDVVASFGQMKIVVKTNSHGMRWREVPVNKPPMGSRIAFVGDSFTFGQWADRVEQSLVAVFEDQMAPNGVEALNFGVPGYGLADIELLIREQVLKFQPESIVLMFYNGNDFLDTYLGLNRYSVTENGSLRTNNQVLESKIPEPFRPAGRNLQKFLIDHSYLARLLKTGINSLNPADQSAPRKTKTMNRSYTSNLFWSQTDYPEFAIAAKHTALEALERITILCRQNDVEFRIVSIPSMEQVNFPTDLGSEYRRDLPQRYLSEFAASHSVPFLDLLPGLALVRDSGREIYYPADGHFNNEGHRVVGGLLSAFFTQQPGRVLRTVR